MKKYIPLLEGKRIALVVNQSSKINQIHLVDTLLRYSLTIQKIFAPEHGFRGDLEAGASVENTVDHQTNLPVISLYGKKVKPSPQDLSDVDLVVFDIQDVGVRFFTYISTLHYVMEACAENNVKLLILDRPNPNSNYIDGPVLSNECKSFIGIHPIPIVYGMTLAELAKMIQGEAWIHDYAKLKMLIVPCLNYTHKSYYELPDQVSPNLKNQRSVLLYPSLCFFEGTCISLGRGTEFPFQTFGHPLFKGKYPFSFTPQSRKEAIHPPLLNNMCFGPDLRDINIHYLYNKKEIQLNFLLEAYRNMPIKDSFFLKSLFIDKLAGNKIFRKQIQSGQSESEIRKSWEPDLKNFKSKRKKYLIYND